MHMVGSLQWGVSVWVAKWEVEEFQGTDYEDGGNPKFSSILGVVCLNFFEYCCLLLFLQDTLLRSAILLYIG